MYRVHDDFVRNRGVDGGIASTGRDNMGLDMYLEAELYVGGYNPLDKNKYAKILELTGLDKVACEHSTSIKIRLNVAYWRKDNAIHKWFVDNVQNGADDCESYHVDSEKLAELVALCKRVLATVETVPGEISTGTVFHADGRIEHQTKPGQVVANASIAEAALPTQSGFFFGPTGYDEFYLQGLRDTVKQLEPLLSEEYTKELEFYYRASW